MAEVRTQRSLVEDVSRGYMLPDGRCTYVIITPKPTTALLIVQAPEHFPSELKAATEAKADSQRIVKIMSTTTITYGFANLFVRSNRGVMVR